MLCGNVYAVRMWEIRMTSAVSRIMGQCLYKCEDLCVPAESTGLWLLYGALHGVLFLLVPSLIFSGTIRNFFLFNFKIYLLV